MDTRGTLAVHGRLSLEVRDAASGRAVARRSSPNLIVSAGLTALAQALNWGFIQEYNNTWGNPYAASSGDLGPVYGAVGTSSTAPTASDTGLGFEVGRQLITNSAFGGGILTLSFFMPTAVGNGSIVEAGVFVGAGLVMPTLTSTLTSGSAYTTLPVSGVTADIPSGSTVTLGYGSAQVQTLTTTADTPIGATSMPVSSFTAAATYTGGTVVAYTPGTLLDHAVFTPAVSKSAAQTATLNLSLSLTSG